MLKMFGHDAVRGVPMNVPRMAAAFLGFVLVAVAPIAVVAHSLKSLESRLLKREAYVEITNRKAPNFTLRDADDRHVSLDDFRGKVVVLDFIYASCPDVCPVQSGKIAEIQEMINQTPMRDLVQFISITTDPARDTPRVMKEYARAHGLDPVNWTFLTGAGDDPAETRKIAESYGLKFTLVDGRYQVHGVVTHLIDKSGYLRARYHGLRFEPTNMILHINALTNDFH
jgi:protein SCO1/2